jgi:hypothetical protein
LQNATSTGARPGLPRYQLWGLDRGPPNRMALLDRDGQSRDQPRNFVELIVVVVFGGSCEPNQTLLIAHHGRIARDDRWDRVIGMNDWHQITSRIEPAEVSIVAE